MTRQSHGTRNVAAWLFVAFTCLYISTANGVMTYGDDWSMLQVTSSIVEHRGFDVPADTPGVVQGRDGRYYSKYGAAQSVVAVPFYIAGKAVAGALGRPVFKDGHVLQATPVTYMVTMIGVLATAATVAMTFELCVALGFTSGSALMSALALGLGTFAWHYAKTFMTEPTSMLGLTLALFAHVRGLQRSSAGWLALGGAASGLVVLLRVGMIVTLPALGLWLLWTIWTTRPPARRAVFLVAAWSIPLAIGIGLLVAYNVTRFGSVGETGYGDPGANLSVPVWVGLYGFLFSSGKSVFVYAPVLLASLAGWSRLVRTRRMFGVAALAIFACHMAFHASLGYWWGGGVWGPRYMTVLLPIMVVGIAALIEGGLRPWGRAVLAMTFLLSVFVQIASVVMSYITYEGAMEASPALFTRLLWSPADSPVVNQSARLVHRDFTFDLAWFYFNSPWLGWWHLATLCGALVCIAVCIARGRAQPQAHPLRARANWQV